MVQFLAGLQTIPEDLYEAATIDGAGPWRRFRFITMPLLRPITLFVLIMTLAGTIPTVHRAFVMTKGGPGVSSMSVVYMLYSKGFGEYNLGGCLRNRGYIVPRHFSHHFAVDSNLFPG